MTVVLALVGLEAGAVGAEVARRLDGPAVVIPYDSMLTEWPVGPQDDDPCRAACQRIGGTEDIATLLTDLKPEGRFGT